MAAVAWSRSAAGGGAGAARQDPAEEPLAGGRHQQGPPHRAAQPVEAGHQRQVVPRVLGEAEAGIGDDTGRVDAAGDGALDGLAQFGDDLADDVRVEGAVVHVDALAAPVHDHERHPRLGDHRHHAGVGASAADVVDEAGPGGDGLFGHGGAHGVDADDDALGGERADHGQHPAQFLGLVHPGGAGAGGLAADVDQVGSGGHQVEAVLDGGLRVEPLPAVGEGVGRDIDDAHDRTPAPRRQPGHLTLHLTHTPTLDTGEVSASAPVSTRGCTPGVRPVPTPPGRRRAGRDGVGRRSLAGAAGG